MKVITCLYKNSKTKKGRSSLLEQDIGDGCIEF